MVNTYKCPGCGASLEYRPGAGELVCEYCGTHVSVSDGKNVLIGSDGENIQY